MSALAVGGIDGCPAGWLLARTTSDAGLVTTNIFGTFLALLDATRDLSVLAIDIPIGLTTSGSRPADLAARALIGPRASSVFPAPVRATLDAERYVDASDRSFAVHGKRLSKQTFAILPKIREVDRALRASARDAGRVYEVHPEVCFCLMNDERPMRHAKRTGVGFTDRWRLVEPIFPGTFERARSDHLRSHAADDDILDALAALWTARRIHAEEARRFPDGEVQFDSVGLPMAIWG